MPSFMRILSFNRNNNNNPIQPTRDLSTLYSRDPTLVRDGTIDPRAFQVAATYEQRSRIPDFEDETVVEYQTLTHILTEYGTAIEESRYVRNEDGERVEMVEVEHIEDITAGEDVPLLALRRRNSLFSRIPWRLIRWSSTTLEASEASEVIWAGEGAVELPEEDPLAFAKAGVVEVRQGVTEMIAPVRQSIRIGPMGRRESVLKWIKGLRKRGGEL